MFLYILTLVLFISNANQVYSQSDTFSIFVSMIRQASPFASKLDTEKLKFVNGNKLLNGKIAKPESIAEYDGYFYSGTGDGKIVKFNDTSITTLPEIASGRNPNRRFLGMRVFDGVLVAVDTFNGVYSIDLKTRNYESNELFSSYDEYGNVKYPFLEDVDMDVSSQTLYIASVTQEYNDTGIVKVKRIGYKDDTGMVIKYNLRTKKEEILVRNLYFCNGILLSKNCDYLLISETMKSKVSRYILKGPNAGTLSVLTKTPGSPANIRPSSNGGYWVAVTRSVILTNEQYLECVAVEIDEYGSTKQIIIPNGNLPCSLTHVLDFNGQLYFGSVTNNFVLKLKPY